MNLVLVGRAMGSVPYRSGMLLTTTVSFVSKKEKLSIKLFTVYDFYCCSLIDICQDPSGISQKISTLRTSQLSLNHDPLARSTVGRPSIIQCLIVPPYRFTVEDD